MMLGDITGQCAMGMNPNYDENGNFVSCTVGSPVQPNCMSGQKLATLADGSYSCTSGITEESIGVDAPDCGGGSPYLDDDGDWQCTAPPVEQQGGGLGMFFVAAGLAVAAYYYFANKTVATYKKISSGDTKQILSAGGFDL
jgi:hypothetical protein